MDSSTYRGLTFLLSLGTLPIACNPEKGDSESDGSTGGATTGGATTTDATTEPTSGTDGTGTDGTGSGTGTSEPTTGSETTGSNGSLCEMYVSWLIMCAPEAGEPNELLMDCETMTASFESIYGPQCAQLFDEALACLSQSNCQDMDPCSAEFEAFYGCSPPLGEACKSWGAKYAECYMSDADMAAKYCQVAVNGLAQMNGPECGAAYEEAYSCLSMLECSEIEMGTGCMAELAQAEMLCGGG